MTADSSVFFESVGAMHCISRAGIDTDGLVTNLESACTHMNNWKNLGYAPTMPVVLLSQIHVSYNLTVPAHGG